MFGFVAVFRDIETGLITSVRGRFQSQLIEGHLSVYEGCRNQPNLRQVKFFLFSKEEAYFKTVLRVKVAELKEYVKYRQDFLNTLIRKKTPTKVVTFTDKMMGDVEKTLMRSVAMRTQMCFNHDIEVTDELALMCYDWKDEKAV